MADVTEMSLRNRGLAFGQGGYPRHQFSDYYYILCANCQYFSITPVDVVERGMGNADFLPGMRTCFR